MSAWCNLIGSKNDKKEEKIEYVITSELLSSGSIVSGI